MAKKLFNLQKNKYLKYIKITPKENANKIKEDWSKQKEDHSFEQLKMKVIK